MPPEAFIFFVQIPNVGVVTKPTSITSHPFLTNVSETILEMCLPDLRASLPTTTTCFNLLEIISE